MVLEDGFWLNMFLKVCMRRKKMIEIACMLYNLAIKENIIKLVGNQIQDIIALETIRSYTIEHLDKSDKDYQKYVSDLNVYIVWKNKTLQNWKYLLSTNLPDSMYYELTYNGDKKEWYLDAYRKVENQCIREETMIAELKERGLM